MRLRPSIYTVYKKKYQELNQNNNQNFSKKHSHSVPYIGLMLAQNDDGPLKWANGPYPIQIHANFQILMGHLKFLWAFAKFDGLKNP